MKEALSENACVKAPYFTQVFYVNPSFDPDAVGAILCKEEKSQDI